MKLAAIGFGNFISVDKIVTILSPDSAPIKRLIVECREKGRLVDASFGRSTRSAILMNSGHMVLSAQPADELVQLIQNMKGDEEDQN